MVVRLPDEADPHRAARDVGLRRDGAQVVDVRAFLRDGGLPKLPNVVVTPHIAGATDGTSRRRAACVAENVDRIAQGLEPKYRVDQP